MLFSIVSEPFALPPVVCNFSTFLPTLSLLRECTYDAHLALWLRHCGYRPCSMTGAKDLYRTGQDG